MAFLASGPAKAVNNYSIFPDVANNHWAFWYIESIGQRQIVKPNTDGTFGATNQVSRGLAATALAKAAGITPCCNTYSGSPCNTCGQTFNDVSQSDVLNNATYYPWVEALARAGIVRGYSDGGFKPTQMVTQGDFNGWLKTALGGKDPVYPTGYYPSYNASTVTQKAQLSSLLAYNFKLNPTLNGLTYKVSVDSSGQPLEPEEPLGAAVVKIFYKSTDTTPAVILRSGWDGTYSSELDIQKVSTDLLIQSIDPEKNFPTVTLRQNPTVGSRRGQNPFLKTARATPAPWALLTTKRPDCSKSLYDRIVTVAGEEKAKWDKMYNDVDRKNPTWSDDQVFSYVDRAMRKTYTGSPTAACCTGFVTTVATKAGLVDKNGKSLFSTKDTKISKKNKGAVRVRAGALREHMIVNAGKKYLAADGNYYQIVYYPKAQLLQNFSTLKSGMFWMQTVDDPEYTGHNAIFYQSLYPATKSANTINCSAGPLIVELERWLTETNFVGASTYQCLAQ